MKRSGPLRRRAPLRADPAKARAWAGRRSRLPYRSARKEAARADEFATRAIVFARDGYRCRLDAHAAAGRCVGPLTPHHRRKASAAGAYSVDNLVTLCAQHNAWVEDHPRLARDLGLVVREGDPEWEALGG